MAAPIPTPLWYDATADFLPPTAEWTNKVELADLDGDGRIDLLFANGGNYSEPGDVDGDGDLDLVLADWGPGNNMTNAGGRTRLWLNDGAGRFTDATDGHMPATLVRFRWDLELVDVDNDFDLDALVSCKRCGGSLLFRNDGTGAFEEDPRALPQYTNNYEFEAMDLDGDGFLDLVTINDGEIVGERGSSRITARVHDRNSPSLAAEWQYVEVRWRAGSEEGTVPMRWYGEYLWSARISPEATGATVCAADAASNETCAELSLPP